MKPSVNIGRGSHASWKFYAVILLIILAVVAISGRIAYMNQPGYTEWRIITPQGVFHDSNCIAWNEVVRCNYGDYYGNVVLQRTK